MYIYIYIASECICRMCPLISLCNTSIMIFCTATMSLSFQAVKDQPPDSLCRIAGLAHGFTLYINVYVYEYRCIYIDSYTYVCIYIYIFINR